MKLTKAINLLFAVAMVVFFTTACNKDEKDNQIPDSSSVQQLVKDEVTIESSSEDALSDANDVLSNGTLKDTQALPSVTDTTIGDTIIYTITFNNSLNHNGTKLKTGKLIVKKNINTPWWQALTTVSIIFENLKIEKAPNGIPNGNWVILNGTKIWKNVSGGLIKNLSGTGSVVYTIAGSLQATFNDNTTRTWNVNRQFTYTGNYANNDLTLSLEGLGSSNSYNNLVVWGTNRHGENFYTQINQAAVHKQKWGWDPVSGIKIHQIPSDNKTATITFGYNNNNQLVTNPNIRPTRLKIDWVKGSYSGTIFLDLP